MQRPIASIFAVLLCVSCGGGGDDSGPPVTPTPPPLPTATLTVDRTSIFEGGVVTLQWSSTNATACSAGGAWSGSKAATGTEITGAVDANSTFSLTCSGAGGTTAQQSVLVAVPFRIRLSSAGVNDVLWDPVRDVLYLAIGPRAKVNPNTITVFDPMTGTLGTAVFAGSEPDALAISEDGEFLYVGFAGTNTVRRLRLPTLASELVFPVDPDHPVVFDRPVFARQIAVAPGNPQTIAVARREPRSTPATDVPFQIFDDQTARPFPNGAFGEAATSVAWGEDASTLFTVGQGGTLLRYSTGVGGTSSQGFSTESTSAFSGLFYDSGVIYASAGNAFMASTLTLANTFSGAGVLALDAANDTIFVAGDNVTAANTIISYDQVTYAEKERIDLTGTFANGAVLTPVPPRRLVRWGVDGLALVAMTGQLAIISGSFVAAGGVAKPVGTIPGAEVCCNTGLQISPTTTILSIKANDLAWDATRGVLLASIPANATDHPQSIAVIDPVTGIVTASSPTAGEPGALALSDDGQFLYVAEPQSVQRFLLPALTLDLTIPLPGNPTQIVVAPGEPNTFAVVQSSNVATIYDDDQTRAGAAHPVTWVQWGADDGTLFGFDGASSGFKVSSWVVDAGGAVSPPTEFGSVFDYPLPPDQIDPVGITFHAQGGLLFADSGAVFDPATRGVPGTLPFTAAAGLYALGTLSIDSINRRAYALVCAFNLGVCSNHLASFDLDTYRLIATGPVQTFGYAYKFFKTGPTAFAGLAADRSVVLYSGAL
jgi:hypothetical protein